MKHLTVFLLFIISLSVHCAVNSSSVHSEEYKSFLLTKSKAEKGTAYSQFLLGLAYNNGNIKEVPQDYGKALYWFEKAAKQGVGNAMMFTSQAYKEGKGTKKDLKKALYWDKQSKKHEGFH